MTQLEAEIPIPKEKSLPVKLLVGLQRWGARQCLDHPLRTGLAIVAAASISGLIINNIEAQPNADKEATAASATTSAEPPRQTSGKPEPTPPYITAGPIIVRSPNASPEVLLKAGVTNTIIETARLTATPTPTINIAAISTAKVRAIQSGTPVPVSTLPRH